MLRHFPDIWDDAASKSDIPLAFHLCPLCHILVLNLRGDSHSLTPSVSFEIHTEQAQDAALLLSRRPLVCFEDIFLVAGSDAAESFNRATLLPLLLVFSPGTPRYISTPCFFSAPPPSRSTSPPIRASLARDFSSSPGVPPCSDVQSTASAGLCASWSALFS